MSEPVSEYAPKYMSAEQMRVVMEQAMGRIGDIAVEQANAAIEAFDKKTAHDRECLVQMRDEIVKYAAENKIKAGESALRLGRFQENMQRSMTEFREPLPEPEHPRDLDEAVQDVEHAVANLVHERPTPMLGVRSVVDEAEEEPVPAFLMRARNNDRERGRHYLTNGIGNIGERFIVAGLVVLGVIFAVAARMA